jgi:hypothetical protein
LIGIDLEDTFILGKFTIPAGSFFLMRTNKENEELKNNQEEDEKKIDQKNVSEIENLWLQNMNIVPFAQDNSLTEQINNIIDKHFYTQNPKIKKLLDKELELKLQREKRLESGSKLQKKNKNKQEKGMLEGFSESIPMVYFGPHSRHATQVIEKLIPYLCIAAYGAQPSDVIKDICQQSEEAKTKLSNAYLRTLIFSKKKELSNSFMQEMKKLNDLIKELSEQKNRTSEQLYKDYIGYNSSKNIKFHKRIFFEWFIKAQYLSNPDFILNPAPVKVLNEIVADKDIVSKNLSEWYWSN